MTRRTLKDFLNFSGHANVNKISYDVNNPSSGQIETVNEGDDLGTDPNTGQALLGQQGILGHLKRCGLNRLSKRYPLPTLFPSRPPDR